MHYLLPSDVFMADPSAHVFDGRLYIYPSHDVDCASSMENDNGDHFNMRDYHVLSLATADQTVATDHGLVLDLDQIPWAGRQLWDCDVAVKDGTYYMYFPMKDKNDVFHLGVATSDSPAGPFTPLPDPIRGSYSIDPCVFRDDDGQHYIYFGGLWGGQLQRYRDNLAIEEPRLPEGDEPALPSRVVRLADDMTQFAEQPRPVVILDEQGQPLRAGDTDRRFFEASWMHKYKGRYYLSYSTGDTHRIVYAVGDNPYGPFTYQGVILQPVVGWTTHHCIVEFQGRWFLIFHDSQPSGGKTWLRSLKIAEIDPETLTIKD